MTDDEFKGLVGEIVEYDVYRVRKMDDIVSINDPTYIHVKGHERFFNFEPDIIFDLGANVGVFSRYVHNLYPKATIISVEPNEDNLKYLTWWPGANIINKAVGQGQMYRFMGAVNGAQEVYLSKGLGYSQHVFDALEQLGNVAPVSIDTVMFDELYYEYVCINPQDKVFVKLDIEGNETVLFSHQPSMEALCKVDALVAELHYFANDGELLEKVKAKTEDAIKMLKQTHDVVIEGCYLYAVKR